MAGFHENFPLRFHTDYEVALSFSARGVRSFMDTTDGSTKTLAATSFVTPTPLPDGHFHMTNQDAETLCHPNSQSNSTTFNHPNDRVFPALHTTVMSASASLHQRKQTASFLRESCPVRKMKISKGLADAAIWLHAEGRFSSVGCSSSRFGLNSLSACILTGELH